jgi:uncharacterized repeat protein (TIGR02543 family)/LPXTG-motif cell wall-anchored protein
MKELKKTLAALMAALTIFGTALITPIAAEDSAANTNAGAADSETIVLTFNSNGGSTAAPEQIEVASNGEVTLPDYTGTKQGKTFIGWAVTNNVIQNTYYQVYTAGSVDKFVKSTTLYAVWSTTANAEFYIRKDGTIPYEPSQYVASEYTAAIKIAGAIKSTHWVCDTTGAAVEANLSATPTDEQIKGVLSTYDSEKQYVMWYVIKVAGSWHVDGVVLEKKLVNLSYDGNAKDGSVSNVPLGSQYLTGNEAKVGHTGGNDGALMTPSRPGYTFIGWNTKADGTGASYANDAVFTIEEATTLYAQWKQDIYTVTYTKGDHGTFADQSTENLIYGKDTPEFNGTPTGEAGYNFTGWDKQVAATVTGSITYTAQWELQKFNVSYNWNGITGTQPAVPSSATVDYGTAYAPDTTYTGSSTFTNEYGTWTFSGWDKTAEFKVTADAEITGTWTLTSAATKTVNYSWKGITGTEPSVPSSSTVNYGSVYAPDTTYTGSSTFTNEYGTWTFSGWGRTALFEVTEDTEITGSWTLTAPISVTVKADDGSKKYDGSALTAGATVNDLPDGFTYEVKTEGSQINAGTSENKVASFVILDKNGNDVTKRFNVTTETGTLTVEKRNVTLTSGTSAKKYDGTALTNENVLVSGDGFAEGEGAEYTVTGTQTEKGSSDNTFTYTMNEGTNADNYNVTVINGTLTVADRPVTPIAPDESETPVTPVTPVTPEEPARPVTPVTPDEPEATETPAVTETPTTAENEETAAAVNRPHTPNTGDATNSGLAAGVFGFAMLAAGFAFFLKKKYTD